MHTRKYILYALSLAAMAGCSTPQVALDQANHGVSLISQLELELKEFRRIETGSEKFLVDSVEQQQNRSIALTRALVIDDLARQAVGDARSNKIIANMTSLVQGLAENDLKAIADQKAVSAKLSSLLMALPSTAAATTDVQGGFAVMGKEMAWSDRQAELKSLAEVVQKSVKENKMKIDEANASIAR